MIAGDNVLSFTMDKQDGFSVMNEHELRECIETAANEGWRELAFTYDYLVEIPAEIGKLNRLEKLYLNNNEISRIPPEIGLLENLTTLILSDNQIIALPREVARLKRLRVLELDNNPLKYPPEEVVKKGARAIVGYYQKGGR